MKKIIPLLFFIFTSFIVSAQWRIGVYGGGDLCYRSLHTGNWITNTHTAKIGGLAGVNGQYNFKEWLGVRADLNLQFRNYNSKDTTLNYRNRYLTFPIMANISMGNDRLRGYVNIGGYLGYWTAKKQMLSDNDDYSADPEIKYDFSDTDKRYDAGLVGGLGVSFVCTESIVINLEGMMYYGRLDNGTNALKPGKYPSYDVVMCLNFGISYYFGNL